MIGVMFVSLIVSVIVVVLLLIVGVATITHVDNVEGINSQYTITEGQTITACTYNENAIGLSSLNTTSRGILVPVSSDYAFSGSAGIGLDNSNQMHYLSVDHNSRIRQLGTVEGVTIETDTDFDDAGLTAFSVSVWRKSGSTYDLIGQTGNIISDLKSASGSGVQHTINFAPGDFIANVQEGDYVGYNFNGTGSPTLEAINAQGETSGVSTRYFDGSNPTSFNVDWDSQSSLNDWANIQLLMDSPSIIFLGQSITAGNIQHEPYLKESTLDDPESTISYKVGDSLGISTQNFGNAGATGVAKVTHGVSAMSSMVIPTNPKVLVIAYGHNDHNAGTPISEFRDDLQSIVDQAQANGMTPVLQGIYRYGGTGMSSENNVIKDIASAEGISIIDVDPVIANQNSEDTCLLTSFKQGYTSDGSHLTETANEAVADFLVNPVDPSINATETTYTTQITESQTERIIDPYMVLAIISVVLIAVTAFKGFSMFT